jgi:soluble lytic murein transglycosylase
MRYLRHSFVSPLTVFLLSASLFIAPLTGCGAQAQPKGFDALRALTRNGRPDEKALEKLEKDFPNTKLAGLARLARARSRMAAGDFANATPLLESKVVSYADLAEYVLLWRAKSLAQTGRRADAEKLYQEYADDYADSHLARDAKIVQAENLLANGQTAEAQTLVKDLAGKRDGSALAIIAQAYEKSGDAANAQNAYRRLYFFAPKQEAALAWAAKQTAPPAPANAEEAYALAVGFYEARSGKEAADAFAKAVAQFPQTLSVETQFQRGFAAAGQKRAADAAAAFNAVTGERRPEALYNLAQAYANSRLWAQTRQPLEELRRSFAQNDWTPRALVNVGNIAFDANNKAEAQSYYSAALGAYPKRAATAAAHFNLGWIAHERKSYAEASRLFTEHLADYADKSTDFRGRAAYWAARDAERANQKKEAVALYRALLTRYEAHWYGYLAKQRLAALGNPSTPDFPADSTIGRAVANLKTVSVAQETAGGDAEPRLAKAEQLDLLGEPELAVAELNQALKKYPSSLKLNLAVAKIYRARQQNLAAFNALKKVYPDYAQMKPEELTPDEWDVFYPLNYWEQITTWAKTRNLDAHQVAGLIRQESVFDPKVKSGANAYGLMQLLIPTARAVAKRYNTQTPVNETTIYQPALNIELGTGYMRDQYDKFGRIEYVAAAYNAGPGRVPQWRAALPAEMDEWAEAIPFKETRGYVQGVVRNTLQYRRLYDANGKFKPEVGREAAKRSESVQVKKMDEEE